MTGQRILVVDDDLHIRKVAFGYGASVCAAKSRAFEWQFPGSSPVPSTFTDKVFTK